MFKESWKTEDRSLNFPQRDAFGRTRNPELFSRSRSFQYKKLEPRNPGTRNLSAETMNYEL